MLAHCSRENKNLDFSSSAVRSSFMFLNGFFFFFCSTTTSSSSPRKAPSGPFVCMRQPSFFPFRQPDLRSVAIFDLPQGAKDRVLENATISLRENDDTTTTSSSSIGTFHLVDGRGCQSGWEMEFVDSVSLALAQSLFGTASFFLSSCSCCTRL